MQIVGKNDIKESDKQFAFNLLNRLRSGDRVFGSPGAALQKQLNRLESEDAPAKDSFDSIAFNLYDRDYEEKIAKLKKGIDGEEKLAQYFEKILRLDKDLSDIIVVASLGDEDSGKDYIPDTDFLLIYGTNLLAVDAKNVKTNPDIPLFVDNNAIYYGTNHNEPFLEVNPSTHVWKEILDEEFCDIYGGINGCVCIINKSGASIFKDKDWELSDIKPLHISELVDFLHKWIKGKDSKVNLAMLVEIMKHQISLSEKSLDISLAKEKIFG